ncbi:MAG: hopanoid biosynthesis-associated protein HpnK [Methylobacteriaceae bacterium]|nr:hopanoid biosynthesis-associated protein HpnK [Methylobacteriaceae bacterium]
MRLLIVTADDFGLSPEVNEAVEIAHRTGILTSASLMMAGPSAADAVARARRMPNLRVGLHLTLVEGNPVLPRGEIADLVRQDGRLRTDMAGMSLGLALRPRARRQLEKEIAAQFEAYRKTGLVLDHIDAHKHFHVNPLIGEPLLRIGVGYGMRALRVPREPAEVLRSLEPGGDIGGAGAVVRWLAQRLARRARQMGIAFTDRVFGLAWTGAMTRERMEKLIKALPDGSTEIYAHPGTADTFPASVPGARYREELEALTAPSVLAAVREANVAAGGYADEVGRGKG